MAPLPPRNLPNRRERGPSRWSLWPTISLAGTGAPSPQRSGRGTRSTCPGLTLPAAQRHAPPAPSSFPFPRSFSLTPVSLSLWCSHYLTISFFSSLPLFPFLSLSISIYLSIHPSIHLPIYLSLYPSPSPSPSHSLPPPSLAPSLSLPPLPLSLSLSPPRSLFVISPFPSISL